MPPDATVCAELERLLQKIRNAARRNLIASVDNYEADVMDKYYEKQFGHSKENLTRLILIMTTSGSFQLVILKGPPSWSL